MGKKSPGKRFMAADERRSTPIKARLCLPIGFRVGPTQTESGVADEDFDVVAACLFKKSASDVVGSARSAATILEGTPDWRVRLSANSRRRPSRRATRSGA